MDSYDEDKKLLGLEKSRLIKENQGKKERLEALEASVDAFMVVGPIPSSVVVARRLTRRRRQGRFRPR